MFLTEKVPSDKIRDNETAEKHFQNLEWWSGRHRGAGLVLEATSTCC